MKDKKLTVVGHLQELRWRLLVSFSWILICSSFSYIFSKQIREFLTRGVDWLVFISPEEALYSHIQIALISGLFLASPVVIYQVWRFVAAGLKKREKRYLLLYGLFSLLLFIAGVAFAYFIILPLGMKFLLGFATDTLRPMISISRYISFVGTFSLAFGLVFELPLVVLFLTKIGIISPHFLARRRKYVILFIFILAAILTPPDVFTQILLAVPMLLLFEASIWLSRLAIAKAQKYR